LDHAKFTLRNVAGRQTPTLITVMSLVNQPLILIMPKFNVRNWKKPNGTSNRLLLLLVSQ